MLTKFNLRKIIKVSTVFSFFMLAFSCGKQQQTKEDVTFSSGEVISIRPQKRSKSVQLFKLSSPPLLTVAKKENGAFKIDEKSKENLLREQELFLKAAKEISPDIKVIYKFKNTFIFKILYCFWKF